MTATSYPTTPHATNAFDYFDKQTKSLHASITQAAGPSQQTERDESQVTAAIPTSSSSNQSRNTHRRVAFFQHCAIIPDPPHLLQETKPSIQKRFSFATRSSNSNTNSSSSSHLNQTSSSSSSHKRNKSASSSSTATQSGFGSTLSSDQHKLGSTSGSIKKSRRTSLDIGGGGGLRIGGGFSSNQEESQSGGKWRIKTLNKIGNVLAAATSNPTEPHSSEEESSHYIQDVDAEEYLNTVSFRDEIISKIAKGNNVVENCKLLEEFEKKKGNDKDEGEGTLKAKANGNHHQTTTAKRKKKKLKLKSALRPSSQFADSDYNSEQVDGLETSSSRESLALSDIQNETPEERIQRKSERANRLKRHDGQGPPIASLLSDSPTSSPSPSSQLSTSSGKSLSISLYSGKEDSEHVKAVEIARRLGGLVIPLETECSCKDCQSKIEIGLGDAYEPSWSKTARLKYIAGREQAKILARQRIDAAKRLAEKAEREEEMAVYHHGLGGNGSGPNPLIPSWASPNHLSPVGSRSSTPKISGDASEVEDGSSDSSQKQKEIPLSSLALTRAAQISSETGLELPRISSNNEASSGDEAGLLAASNATGLKLELEDDRIDSNRTPEIEGPRPIRSSLDLARPSSKEDQEGDYFDSERLKPPTLRIPSSNLDSSSDQQSPYSDSASEPGPSIIRPSPKRATGGSFSSSSPATSPITESRPTPLSPETELPPLISNPIDDELVDELRALRLKAEEAARHRAASPRIRSGGGARAMMRQLEAAESRESLASIERTRSANSNRRNANISSESHASSASGWGGISPSPSPRGWDGPGIGRIGSPPIRAWSPAIDQNVATSPPTSPITRTLSPPFIHRATSPTISRSNSPSSPMMRSSPLGRVSSIPEPNGAHHPSLLHLQQGNESHSHGGHSLLRTCQDAADNEVQTRPPLIIQRPKARPASAVQDVDNPPVQENSKEEILQNDSSSLPSVSVTYPTLDKAPPTLAAALELKEEPKKEEAKPFPRSPPSSKQGEVLSKADQLPPQRHQRSKSSSSISSSSYQTHALVAAFGSPITSVGSMDNVNNSPRLQRTASSSERHKNQVQRPKPSRAYSSQNKISKTDPLPASTSNPNTYIPSQSGASSGSTSNDISKAAKKGLSFIKNLI